MKKLTIIDELRDKFFLLIKKNNLISQKIFVRVNSLSATEAIGNPSRKDYPILEGKEIMIEAEFQGSFGQAFTDHPQQFEGTLSELLNLDFTASSNRAVFIASLNAVTSYLGMASGMRHCHDDEPEKCAEMIANQLVKEYGRKKIGLIGLQPAILDYLAQTFGVDNVLCSDLNPKNIGSNKSGVTILDGKKDNLELVKKSDIVLITSSAIVNGTIDRIRKEALAMKREFIIFGVSGAGAAVLLDIRRLCFLSH